MTGTLGEIREQVCDLQLSDPQKFGYLAGNWRAVKTGLDNTERTFAQAHTICANITTADLDPPTVGYTLQILVDLDILATADSGRNAAALYDLRSYDPDALETVGQVLSEVATED